MKIHGNPHRTIETDAAENVRILDQTLLPHDVVWRTMTTWQDAAKAISIMQVRGAPLIGVTAAFGVALAMRDDASDTSLDTVCKSLFATRPTAVNLRWGLDRMKAALGSLPSRERAAAAWSEAVQIADEDVRTNESIGRNGHELFQRIFEQKAASSGPLNVMTHCNAGWLAAVDWGMSLSPVYQAHDAGMPVHVWVSETRPRNQGAALTAFELNQHGVPHTLISDNAAGHLMQRGLVDLCITGADRVTASGDVANKIGTYLKALAAKANNVPFYVAVPVSTIDWTISDGVRDIPIEQRSSREVTHIPGRNSVGAQEEVLICPENTPARNDAFDVTPAALVSALITEHAVVDCSAEGLLVLKPA